MKKLLKGLGFSPTGFAFLVILAILPFIPPFNSEYIIRWLIAGAFIGAQAVAFDLTQGYINVVNFGFAAILGLGAYTSAILTNTFSFLIVQPGLPPWFGIIMGGVFSACIGFIFGLLTLRLRGIYAAIMAWFAGIAILGLTRNLTPLTRGAMGLSPVSLFETSANLPYYYVILIMMTGIYIVSKIVVNSHYGLAFRAIGQNIDAARASGINPTKYRVLNFTLSSFFAGLLGGFYAHYYVSLLPKALMHTSKTVEVLAIAFIGGRGSLWGGICTAFPFVFFIEYIRSNLPNLPGLHMVIYGILMILVMIFYPNGLAGIIRVIGTKIRGKISNNPNQS
ncbi:hypothetical protein GF339_05195 [candidate division KSB3 bacterium]|uniref:Branched-chain amino acid ABC transporter permease n=1 Tax=candidate division KSB3 bacterium TaxID=2044937 RepID=A0A9D5JTJ7_9BACT|nr:hypothetical protein [candidate division KSB3 bacterium]MBD3323957.1 hypothetical protein [candidate division KSB3 bacterium]